MLTCLPISYRFLCIGGNVGACAVAGIGGLVKGDSPTSPTSCDLSHVINLNKETESYEDTKPGHCRKHIVVCSTPPLGTLSTDAKALDSCVGQCGLCIGAVYEMNIIPCHNGTIC